MILIAGDSWGCGEWNRGDLSNRTILHTGLEHYILENSDQAVVNLSVAGLSNISISSRVSNYLNHYRSVKVDSIIVFQTEYTRDKNFVFAEDFDKIETPWDLSDRWISRFYYRLVEIAEQANCEVALVGGASDTIFSGRTKEYPGLNFACQSLTNLIVNNNHQVDNPVLSLYSGEHADVLDIIKKNVSTEYLSTIDELVNLSFERVNTWGDYPEYFFPDGVHPNRLGHKILFDFLKNTGVIHEHS